MTITTNNHLCRFNNGARRRRQPINTILADANNM
jgi:hypothetical protein